jgi:hypothetical protein
MEICKAQTKLPNLVRRVGTPGGSKQRMHLPPLIHHSETFKYKGSNAVARCGIVLVGGGINRVHTVMQKDVDRPAVSRTRAGVPYH